MARQGAGDFSRAPVPDLVITRNRSAAVRALLDLGAGRFSTTLVTESMIAVPPNTRATILTNAPTVIEMLSIPYTALSALCAGHELPVGGHFGPVHKAMIDSTQVGQLFGQISEEIRARNPNGAMFIEGAVLQMTALLVALSKRPFRTARSGLAPWQLARATDCIHGSLASSLSLRELAGTVGLSAFHFARAFKISTGLAPHQYQVSLRMKHAGVLLRSTDRSITEVSHSIGYDSSQSFSRAFRRYCLQTPTQYRSWAQI